MKKNIAKIPNISNRSNSKSVGDLTIEEWEWMKNNWALCPDCGYQLYAGPEGGGSQNCACSNAECRSEFNHGGFYCSRNGKMNNDRRKWFNIPDVDISVSDFAKKRHSPEGGYTYFSGSEQELISLINEYWNDRYPGKGRTDLKKVIIVPLPPDKFVGKTVLIDENTSVIAKVSKRQDGEDFYIKLSSQDKTKYIEPKFAKAVLYSSEALEENNGKRSSNSNWEIVALIASDVEEEPMHPLTMARNFLQKPGGTFAPYTAKEFAESIYYWSQRIGVE